MTEQNHDGLPEDSLLSLFVADYQVTDGTFGPDLTPFKQGWPWEGRLFDPSFFGLSYQTPLSYLPEPEHQSFAIPDPGEPYETPDGP